MDRGPNLMLSYGQPLLNLTRLWNAQCLGFHIQWMSYFISYFRVRQCTLLYRRSD